MGPPSGWSALPPEPIRVAIVGAGPAGIFAATHLRDLSAKQHRPILITIFERKSSIGGRLIPDTPIFPFDNSHETPLSAEASSYTSPASDLKDIVPTYKSAGWPFQLWKNVEKTLYVYNKPVELTRPSSAASFGSRVWEWWCFGGSVNGAKGIGSQYRRQIRKIRELGIQDSVNAIINLLELDQPRSTAGAAIFAHHGVSKTYINRIIKSESLVQFGQEADSMNLFTLGMMAYAADEGKSQKGGRLVSVLEDMLSRSRNIHLRLNTEAFGLRKLNSTKWVLASRHSRTLEDETGYLFDGVILAAPIASLQLDVRDANLTFPGEFVEYQPRHVTWFTSSNPLDSGQVGEKGLKYPSRIITRIPPSWKTLEHKTGAIEIFDMGFHIQRSPYGNAQERMYRVLSDMHVTDENVRDLLGGKDSSWIARHHIEQGYPVLGPQTSFSAFILDDLVWHTSALEELHSSVGVSAWAGKNVADLAFRKIRERN